MKKDHQNSGRSQMQNHKGQGQAKKKEQAQNKEERNGSC